MDYTWKFSKKERYYRILVTSFSPNANSLRSIYENMKSMQFSSEHEEKPFICMDYCMWSKHGILSSCDYEKGLEWIEVSILQCINAVIPRANNQESFNGSSAPMGGYPDCKEIHKWVKIKKGSKFKEHYHFKSNLANALISNKTTTQKSFYFLHPRYNVSANILDWKISKHSQTYL